MGKTATATAKSWFLGVTPMDALAAMGGLALSAYVPGMLIKTTETGGQKFMKILISLGTAAGTGMLVSSVADRKTAQSAVLGGLAGVASQTIAVLTGITIGKGIGAGAPPVRRLAGKPVRMGGTMANEYEFSPVQLN